MHFKMKIKIQTTFSNNNNINRKKCMQPKKITVIFAVNKRQTTAKHTYNAQFC